MPRKKISTDRQKPTIQQHTSSSIQNNFTGGLKTEFTGLNFPENACTSVDNCVFSIIGDVLRREGIDFEANAITQSINTTNAAVNSFRWLNAGGDGLTEVVVLQVGSTLYFFQSSAATAANPLSSQKLASTVNIASFIASGSSNPVSTVECQFAAGNGYLFVYHPACDPFYCVYSAGTITASIINVQIRDFTGVYEPGLQGLNVNTRPSTLSTEHNYNLYNQGWTAAPSWTVTNGSLSGVYIVSNNGIRQTTITFVLSGNISAIALGQQVQIAVWGLGYGTSYLSATVSGWNPSTFNLIVTVYSGNVPLANSANEVTISSSNTSLISTWFSDVGNYPSNADIWWTFKDSTDIFNPTTTVGSVISGSANAPQGHFVLNAFQQLRSAVSSVSGLTDVTTSSRPQTGTWFQGRVWYTGVNASQVTTGDALYYTWTENIYFSQIITDVTQFGMCFQENDPTNENAFDLLPTDGGVIQIQGAGAIQKLFPIQNGLLVFADNGVWFITGSSGIGFAADDYTITKISSVQNISSTSFIDVLGLPMFWNEEGIYAVEPAQGRNGGLAVNPLTVGTILSFYNNIPLDSKRFVRGDYNPISYTVSWVYRSTQEAGISNRYQFDSVLNLNIYNKAFYPYTISSNSNCFVNGIFYLNYPSGTLDPIFKYLTTTGTSFTFSEENDDVHYVDWFTHDGVGVNYVSSFITGYQIKGQALVKFQPMYMYIFSRNDVNNGYKYNSIWDFATSGNSGKFSTVQVINNAVTNFGMVYRRHRIRGRGLAYQLQVQSVDGMPFDIMGWTVLETISGNV